MFLIFLFITIEVFIQLFLTTTISIFTLNFD